MNRPQRRRLMLGQLFVFGALLAFCLGWEVVTDRRMLRDSRQLEERLLETGMPSQQVHTITSGVSDAYRNAQAYASTLLFVIIVVGNGTISLLWSLSQMAEDSVRRDQQAPPSGA